MGIYRRDSILFSDVPDGRMNEIQFTQYERNCNHLGTDILSVIIPQPKRVARIVSKNAPVQQYMYQQNAGISGLDFLRKTRLGIELTKAKHLRF